MRRHNPRRQKSAENLARLLSTKEPKGGVIRGQDEPIDPNAHQARGLLFDDSAEVFPVDRWHGG